MPELAEVEVIRRGLETLVGRSVVDSDGPPHVRFSDGLDVRGKIAAVVRAGKRIGVGFDDGSGRPGHWLHIHLGMTGQLLTSAPTRYRVAWHLDDGSRLYLADVRGFGRCTLADEAPTAGPEPIERGFERHLLQRLARSQAPLFAQLLDQSTAPGVGAYLAQEALWYAGLDPARRQVTEAEGRELARALRRVANMAIAAGGMTRRDYRHLDGSQGRMQERLRCYGRHGSRCANGDHLLARTRIAGRTVSFCPVCQH